MNRLKHSITDARRMVNNGFELLLSSPLRADFVSWPSIASQTVYCWPLENA